MGDILSQSEIDDLFKALNTGELNVEEIKSDTEKKNVKVYDFARPSKFSKEQLRTLEIISESYARLVGTYLSGYLRTMVSVEVVNAEAVTYSEFSNVLTNPVVLALVELAPLSGTTVFELSPNMGYAIIDRVLGGIGKGINKLREFTDIEHMILERLFVQFANLLVEPWSNVIDLSPVIENIETNSQVVQIISPNEIVALITFSIKVGQVEGMMNFCIPHLVLEPIMDKLNTKFWFSRNKTVKDEQDLYEEEVEKSIEHIEVPVTAVLGKTHITIDEFLKLQAKDIIKLDTTIHSDLDVYVGNIVKFKAKPGNYRNKAAAKIQSIVAREDE